MCTESMHSQNNKNELTSFAMGADLFFDFVSILRSNKWAKRGDFDMSLDCAEFDCTSGVLSSLHVLARLI